MVDEVPFKVPFHWTQRSEVPSHHDSLHAGAPPYTYNGPFWFFAAAPQTSWVHHCPVDIFEGIRRILHKEAQNVTSKCFRYTFGPELQR